MIAACQGPEAGRRRPVGAIPDNVGGLSEQGSDRHQDGTESSCRSQQYQQAILTNTWTDIGKRRTSETAYQLRPIFGLQADRRQIATSPRPDPKQTESGRTLVRGRRIHGQPRGLSEHGPNMIRSIKAYVWAIFYIQPGRAAPHLSC